MSETTWPAKWKELWELDGDEGDAKSEELDTQWKFEYHRAYVAFALSRPGWNRINAETWATELVDEALIEYHGDPVEAAQKDVLLCEQETP